MRRLPILVGSATFAMLLGASGCTTSPTLAIPLQGRLVTTNAPTLWSMFKDKQDNITPMPLGKTESLSYQIVVVEDRERPHLHARHDLAVTMLEGQGTLHLKDREIAMKAGDVAVIARNTPHYIVNTGATPITAFVVSAPPYDPADNVPVK